MKTIFVDGSGGVFIGDVPIPELFDNSVLCKMTHSLISTGTERGMIKNAIGKTHDDIIKQNIRLGYCGAGIVEEVNGTEIQLKKGDKVAFYGGPYVAHSEYVVVPKHLVFPIPANVEPEYAAFIGVGAIALHGFRLAKTGLGDVCWVAAAGLIGNLCAQFAAIAGCRTIVSDFDISRLELFNKCAKTNGDYLCVTPDKVEETVLSNSEKRGADAILLCMAITSAEPMSQAINLVRAGGRIIVVGVLDIHLSRDALFAKEAEITVSRSAGPGRYDARYEKESIDYPYQYVRWTEGRNLAEVLRLIANNQLNVKPLISQRYHYTNAVEAYTNIMSGKPGLGYILEWG